MHFPHNFPFNFRHSHLVRTPNGPKKTFGIISAAKASSNIADYLS